MEYKPFKDIQLSRLGMGNMRLPLVEGEKDKINDEEAQKIIDYAMAHGINYYDTAHVYNNGDSERFLGQAMKKYPRDSYYLATKFNIRVTDDYQKTFEEQLARLQTDHIDFYLMHAVMDNSADKYLESGAIEYFLEKQKEGKIRYLGFSSHAGLEKLEQFASHHQWDFAQLQINYFDWNYGTAKGQYEILKNHNIPIVVMEPVRGGRLSKLTDEAEAILHNARPDWTTSSWALRFVRTLPQVQVILSGMSTVDQIVDNVATFCDENPLSEEEMATLMHACEVFHSNLVVPCTACHYCVDGCPMGILIPEFMKVYNRYKVERRIRPEEITNVESDGYPTDCIECGQCEAACPQGIRIPEIMRELADLSE